MKLIKNGEIIVLQNENHAEAFKKAGWEEYSEPVKKAKKKE